MKKKRDPFAQTKQRSVLCLLEQTSLIVINVSLAAASWLAFCPEHVFADVSLIH